MEFLSEPYNRQLIVDGFLLILGLTAASAALSFVIGLFLAAMRVSPVPALRAFGTGWVNLFRNTPLTLVIFFCYFGLYTNLGVELSNDLEDNNFWLGVVGLSAYTGSFVCEAIRSGIAVGTLAARQL